MKWVIERRLQLELVLTKNNIFLKNYYMWQFGYFKDQCFTKAIKTNYIMTNTFFTNLYHDQYILYQSINCI